MNITPTKPVTRLPVFPPRNDSLRTNSILRPDMSCQRRRLALLPMSFGQQQWHKQKAVRQWVCRRESNHAPSQLTCKWATTFILHVLHLSLYVAPNNQAYQ